MTKWKLPYWVKGFTKTFAERVWTNALKTTKTTGLHNPIITDRSYGKLGEDFVRKEFQIFNKQNMSFKNLTISEIRKPVNPNLPMIDFIEERQEPDSYNGMVNYLRIPIEVKTFISSELEDTNNLDLLFSKNYYYLPSNIILVELSEYRELVGFYEMDGRKWNEFSKKAEKYLSNNEYFKNKISVRVDITEFNQV
jgi:hypothetical protein